MIRSFIPSLAAAGFAAGLAISGCAQETSRTGNPPADRVDLVIRNGMVMDGEGHPARRADVAVKDGIIVAVAPQLAVEAAQTVDASGLIVTPGFIDVHNHSDLNMVKPEARMNDRFIRQGVTTIIGGQDGMHSPADMRRMLDAYRSHGIASNVAFFVGHNSIRREVMGSDQRRDPTSEELARMQGLVRDGMQMGAVGFSTGLMYSPGLFSKTAEVIALTSVIKEYDGIYASHVRDPHRGLLESNAEAITIGRNAGVPVDLTHATTPGRYNRGKMQDVIRSVEDARASGVTVVTDQYPYHAVATAKLFEALKYPESVQQTPPAVRAALKNPALVAAIRQETLTGGKNGYSQYKASGPDSIMILSCPGCQNHENKFISDIASETRKDPLDLIINLLAQEGSENIIISMGGFDEEAVRLMMKQPWTMIASDGSGGAIGGDRPFGAEHPRSSGTYPRVLGEYVREYGVLTLPDAVRKMTSAPADFAGLRDRGRIRTGAAADIVAFDAATIASPANWSTPKEPPVGIKYVLVNGEIVLRDGALTGATPGQFLKRGAEHGERLKEQESAS